MALTDHNTCKNCPAFFAEAKRNGIIAIAGMELTTSEDIHIIFLFEQLENAMEFDREIEKHRILVKNRVDIYGEQIIMDENDNPVGVEEYLLTPATTVSVDDCPSLAKSFGGICYPAHIDRQANGIIATLGTFPDIKGFNCVELHDMSKKEEYFKNYSLGNRLALVGSDAHYLCDIRDKECFFEIDDEPYSSNLVRHNLFKLLGEKE